MVGGGVPEKKLVGGWTTQLKNMRKSKWIMKPQIGVKIKMFETTT